MLCFIMFGVNDPTQENLLLNAVDLRTTFYKCGTVFAQ